jgi:hypothetical protein
MTDSPTDQPDRASAAPAETPTPDRAERRIQALVDLFTPAASGSPEREARVRAAFLRAVIGDMPGPSADTR